MIRVKAAFTVRLDWLPYSDALSARKRIKGKLLNQQVTIIGHPVRSGQVFYSVAGLLNVIEVWKLALSCLVLYCTVLY